MAENDTHYNGTPEMMNNGDYGLTTPLPEYGEGGPTDPGMNGGSNIPTVPLPYPGEGGQVAPGGGSNIPAVPLPNPGEGGQVAPEGGSNIPAVPLPGPGEGGQVYPGGGSNIPVVPLPGPGEGGQVYPGGGSNIPVIPLPGPGVGGPVAPDTGFFPVFPNYPSISPQYYGQVRFLNASTNSFPVNISIDNSAYAINSRFATISNYDWIADGFHTVTVRRATGLRAILLQQTFPFVAGQKVTMVLTDTAAGGLEMVRVVDTGCSNLPYNSGCYRFANMSFSGSSYDLMFYGGETIFRNVRFQNVTAYKQAVAGSYQFYVTNSGAYAFVRELPIIVIGASSSSGNLRAPLVSFAVDITAGRNYTSYIIGNTWSDNSIRVLTIED